MSKAQKTLTKLRRDIYQANPLVQSCKSLNTQSMRVFYLGLQGVNPHLSDKDKFFDKEFPETFIPDEQLEKIFGNRWCLSELEATCEKMFKNDTIKLNYNDGGWVLMHLFDRLEYKKGEGLYIQFDVKMRPFLLDLIEKSYTKMGIEPIFKLSSPYAMRLLELMLQYQNIPGMEKIIKRTFTPDDIRFYLNVPPDAYQGRQNNFRRFVLDVPIAEINRKTNYHMDYTVFKIGRKTSHFEFTLEIKSEGNEKTVEKSSAKSTEKFSTENSCSMSSKELAEMPPPEEIHAIFEEKHSEGLINPYLSPEMQEMVKHMKIEEPIDCTPKVEKVFEPHMKDIESGESQYDLNDKLKSAKKTFENMRKDAERCGLKLEDFHIGEIPIDAEHAFYLREAYKKNSQLAVQILKEVYGMTPKRFEELYKP